MGNTQKSVLQTPITAKVSADGSAAGLQYGWSEMQGWRVTMEDAHISTSVPPPGGEGEEAALFAVFDGHAGNEVARFCQTHFTEELINNESYKNGDVEEALSAAVFRMDEMLLMDEYKKELAGYRQEMAPPNSAAKVVQVEVEAIKKETQLVQERIDALRKAQGDDNLPVELTKEESEKRMEHIKRIAELVKVKPKSGQEGGITREGLAKDDDIGYLERLADSLIDKVTELEESVPPLDVENYELSSGSTAVIVLIHGDNIYCANTGDSRAVACKRGQAYPMSFDHKPFHPIEKQRIEDAGGFVSSNARVNNYLNLSRSIGDLRFKKNPELPQSKQIITAAPDITVMVNKKDIQFLVVACDGIWDCKSNKQVVDFVIANSSPDEGISTICEKLFDDCVTDVSPLQGGVIGGDNMTCIIVYFQPIQKVQKESSKVTVGNRVYQAVRKSLDLRNLDIRKTLARGKRVQSMSIEPAQDDE